MGVCDVNTITGYTRSLNRDPMAAWAGAKTRFWSQKKEEWKGILKIVPFGKFT